MPVIHNRILASWPWSRAALYQKLALVSSGNPAGRVILHTLQTGVSTSFLLQQLYFSQCSKRGNECSGWFEINFAAAAAIALSRQVGPSATAKGSGQRSDCFCSLLCLSKHTEMNGIFFWRVPVVLAVNHPRSTFCAFFLLYKNCLTRNRKIFWDLELSWASKRSFSGNPDQFDVVPFSSPPSCYASVDVNTAEARLLLLFYIKRAYTCYIKHLFS